MIGALLVFLGGLAVLIGGAELLVRGAAALARRLGVPAVAVGLTVVAFGTSAPELVVNVVSAAEGESGIGFGNVVGSNIANVGLLLGVTVLVRPLRVHRSIVLREIPMLLVASGATVALALDGVLVRGDGAVLLLFFAIFCYYTVADVVRSRGKDSFVAQAETTPGAAPRSRAWIALSLAGGVAAAVAGGHLLVGAATDLAWALGIPDSIIGLTLVAAGTSLPELATSIVAARRGEADLAVGNIVGSNLFNLLFIAGLSATLRPIVVPEAGAVDLFVMTGFALFLLPLSVTHRLQLTRLEGAVLLAGYMGYIAWLALVR